MTAPPRNFTFGRFTEYETDYGTYRTSAMEALVNVAKSLPGAGHTCPRCGNFCALFFGNPDDEQWCAGCQVLNDLFDLTFIDPAMD